jgi:type I restriction enzyme R subunit
VRHIVLMRPVNSMIEFKQIIGRGTRLYDGKDYFTIWDFVKAYEHFNDPEWDGEPAEPVPVERDEKSEEQAETPAEAPADPDEGDAAERQRPQRIKVKLADGKARQIQHMMATTFWHPDGTPMSAQQFLQQLFGELPAFFSSEEELRALWSDPATRRQLLDGLEEKNFGPEQLAEMQRIIDAEQSDLYDVLAHVAFAAAPVTREHRAEQARTAIAAEYADRQRAFLDFVLGHYVDRGVKELDLEQLVPLLKLCYHDSIPDAMKDLGSVETIAAAFTGFQKQLYSVAAAPQKD